MTESCWICDVRVDNSEHPATTAHDGAPVCGFHARRLDNGHQHGKKAANLVQRVLSEKTSDQIIAENRAAKEAEKRRIAEEGLRDNEIPWFQK